MKNKHRYSPNWNLIIRPDILKRDKYKCVICGIANKQAIAYKTTNQIIKIDNDEIQEFKNDNYKSYIVYLQVAHLDQCTDNDDYSNLRSLCPICHLNYDKQFKSFNRISKRIEKEN